MFFLTNHHLVAIYVNINCLSVTLLHSLQSYCWNLTYLHCQTQFQSFRTGWGLSSVICPSSSSIRASVSGGAHSWSRSVAARIRFPEDTKSCYTPHLAQRKTEEAKFTLWLTHCTCYYRHNTKGARIQVVWSLDLSTGIVSESVKQESACIPCGSQARL